MLKFFKIFFNFKHYHLKQVKMQDINVLENKKWLLYCSKRKLVWQPVFLRKY